MIKAARSLALLLSVGVVAGCGASGAFAPQGRPYAFHPQMASGSQLLFVEPPDVVSVDGVATVSLVAKIDPISTLPTFAYQGMSATAPTIRVNPGDKIVLDVADDLPASRGKMSRLNIHFHGLTVSPNAPADDVFTMLALPGESLHYVVPIPKNAEPGLYWYHPHTPKQTDLQVGQAGMSGAIVIKGIEQHLPALKQMKERLMIVRDVLAGSQSSGTSVPRPDASHDPCAPQPSLQITLNTEVKPAILIAPSEKQFFRVVNATGHRTLDLSVGKSNLQLVALDGYPLDSYPGAPATRTVSHVVIPVAGRAEFVVTGSAGGSSFKTACYNAGPTGDANDAEILASLIDPNPRAVSRASAVVRVGAPLVPSVHSDAIPPPVVKRTVVLSEDDSGNMYINGRKFGMDDPPTFTAHAGTVEQWKILNTSTEMHDFHIHQIHFAVQAIDGKPNANRQWIDTAIVPWRTGKNGTYTPGSLTLLMDFRDPVIKGTFMFHCHILDHEDAGMMAKIQVI